MKRFSMLLAAGIVASVALFSACSSLSIQTPAQVASKVCPLLQTEISTLSQAGVFTGGAAVTLNEKIAPKVDAACAAGAAVTQVSVQSISSAVAPLLIAVVKESGLKQSDQVTAVLAIGTIKGMIDAAFPPATVTAPAAASSTSPASSVSPAPSAPVAMTTFHRGDVLTADDLNRNFRSLTQRLERIEERLRPVDISSFTDAVPTVNFGTAQLTQAPM
ncbi:TPA: hypothetical protein ACK3Q6_001582 [Burkholderia cepacia]|uniref:hypothetical protein n=1 Tax=Burkholderia cepacia TaxID=292 RepID=UPI001CF2EA39|nr:hypothetical protein [Burkholderia cepacia]MCA8361665.1 hypothetical protein [Burkholderia cepacia]HDR9760980.1 hypothetical protein [Burkholderia cepacia ATCC 25416]HDV6364629.1 hypothetical protein [Burkholderia cepacia]